MPPSDADPSQAAHARAAVEALRAFFASDGAQRATRPLAEGFRVAVAVEGAPECLLTKRRGVTVLVDEAPGAVEFAIRVPVDAAEKLSAKGSADVPTLAVTLVELFADGPAESRLHARVFAGPFEMLRKGYLSVVPLGGAPLMRALAARGVGGVGAIRERLKRLKEDR